MNKIIIVGIFVLSLFLLQGCFGDSEALEIAKNGHYTDCDSLDTSDNKNRIQNCYATVGERQNDPDACRAIESSGRKSYCLEDVAIDLHDETLCDEVTNSMSKRNCFVEIGVYKNDPSLCRKVGSENVDMCYREFAKKSGDMSVCDNIPAKTDSSDKCLLQFVSESKDESFCDKIGKESNKDTCYSDLAKSMNLNLMCAKIKNSYKRDQCHIHMAIEFENTDECNRMEKADTNAWNTCVKQVAVAKLSPSTCTMLLGSERESCEMQVRNAQEQEYAKENE